MNMESTQNSHIFEKYNMQPAPKLADDAEFYDAIIKITHYKAKRACPPFMRYDETDEEQFVNDCHNKFETKYTEKIIGHSFPHFETTIRAAIYHVCIDRNKHYEAG